MSFYPFSLGFTALFSFVLGVFVVYKNPRSPVNLLWGVSCLFCSLWSACFVASLFAPTHEWGNFFSRAMNVSAAYIPVLMAHFSQKITQSRYRCNWVVWIGYTSAVAISLFGFTDFFLVVRPILSFRHYAQVRPGFVYFTIHFFVYALCALCVLWRGMRRIKDWDKKNKIRYIFIALLVGYIAGSTTFLPVYDILFDPFLTHFVWLYAAIISYAILKHRLMDIEVVIKKTLLYSLFVFLVSMLYTSVIFAVHQFIVTELRTHTGHSLDFLKSRILYSAVPFVGTIVFLSLGLFVLFHKPATVVKRLFALLCIATFVWQCGWFCSFYYPADQAGYLMKICYVGITPLPFIYLAIIVEYFKRGSLRKYVIIFFMVCLFLETILFPTDLFIKGSFVGGGSRPWGYFPTIGPLYPVFMLATIFLAVFGLSIIFGELRIADSHEKKNKTWYFLLAFFLYFCCALDFLQVYGVPWYPVGSIFLLIFSAVVSYAILKRQLMDIRVVLKKTFFYTFLTVFISATYLLLVFAFYFLVMGKKDASPILLNFAGIAFVAVTFKPLEMMLTRFLDKKFFKGSIGEISEQKARLESELERTERLKSVGILAAGMAHEIKNPLTAIRTFAEYLPIKYDDPEFREKFSRITIAETDRISLLIRDLLLFAKPSPPVFERVDVVSIARETLDLLAGDMVKNQITARLIHENDSVSVYAMADRSQIKQALLNILLNAIDAVRPQSTKEITVSIFLRGKCVELAVKDTGVGIAADKIGYLFDPFYSDKEGGNGLGLAMTHSIIRQNSGTICVESVVGQGSVFYLTLGASGL